jgi:glycosyltransferase involved in cell wall biosynthesis
MIAPSSYLRRVLLEQTGARLKSVVIPNFAPYPPKHVHKPDYSDYFLFVGVLEEHKGIMNLLKLFEKLKNRIEAKLVIVGRGSLQTHIQSFITRNSLRKSVFFLGFVDNDTLYSLYRGARALVIPSLSLENSPLVALEALSVGTPAIASDSGGLAEIVSKMDRRLIFRNETELENLLISNSEIQFSRERLKEIYERDFSPRAYVTRYLEVIQGIHPEELRS